MRDVPRVRHVVVMVLKVDAVRADDSMVAMTRGHQVLDKCCSKTVAEASGRQNTGVDDTSKEAASRPNA